MSQFARVVSLLPGGCLAGFLSLFTSGAWAEFPCAVGTHPYVQVGEQRFRVEVAASDLDREKGLSGRATLAAGSGMWFDLPEAGLHGFWMKDMAFPIDLVWISPDRTVLGSVRLEPCPVFRCPIHTPPAPVLHVLEVNAGAFQGRPGNRAEGLCLP